MSKIKKNRTAAAREGFKSTTSAATVFLGTYNGGVAGFQFLSIDCSGISEPKGGANHKITTDKNSGDPEIASEEPPIGTFASVFSFAAHPGTTRVMAAGSCRTKLGRHVLLVTGGSHDTLHLCDVTHQREIGTLEYNRGAITALDVVCIEGRNFVLSSGEGDHGKISIWEGCGSSLQKWRVIALLSGHKSAVFCLTTVASSGLVLSIGHDGTLRLWDLRSILASSELQLHKTARNTKFDGGMFPRFRSLFKVRLAKQATLARWSLCGSFYLLVVGNGVELHHIAKMNADNDDDLFGKDHFIGVDVDSKISCALFVARQPSQPLMTELILGCEDGMVVFLRIERDINTGSIVSRMDKLQIGPDWRGSSRRIKGVGELVLGTAEKEGDAVCVAAATSNHLHCLLFFRAQGFTNRIVASFELGHRVTCLTTCA